MENNGYTAFEGTTQVVRGSLSEVVKRIKKRLGKTHNSSFLIFSDATGNTVDFNFQGTDADIQKRLEVFVSGSSQTINIGPGRPRLGVISREVSLLPHHWEWLATQSGGASATIRVLVEEAKKRSANVNRQKQAQERTYKFMSIIAGDFGGFEEAIRGLYRKNKSSFLEQIQNWPTDIKEHAVELAAPVFDQN